MLEALEDFAKSDRRPELVAVLRRHAPTLLGQMQWLVDEQEARELGDQLAAGTRPRMLREMASALEALCGRGLLWIVEDMHWSDSATLDLLAAVARRRGSANLMVLGSLRDAEAISFGHPVIGLVRDLEMKGQCASLLLDPLPMSTIDAFLKLRLASASPPLALAQLLQDRTDGNPLFLHTLLDHMIDIGWLVDDGGQWRLHKSADLADEAAFPSSLRQMIGAFLDRIDASDLEILEAASVAGVTFSAAGAAAALERPADDLEPIEAACARSADHWDVLQPIAEQTWPDGTRTSRYRFRHVLFHNVLYDRLAPSKRRRLHQLVGERLAEGHRGQTGAIAAELAAHFERSGDDERAVNHLIEAAMGARQRFSENELLDYLSSALDHLLRLSPGLQRDLQEVSLRVSLSMVRTAMRGFDPKLDDEELTARGDRALEELPDELTTFPLVRGLWRFHLLRSDLKRLRPLAQRILAIASATGERTYQIEAGIAATMVHLYSGRFVDAAATAESTWELYREQARDNPPSGETPIGRWPDVGLRIVAPRFSASTVCGQLDRAASAWQDGLETVRSGPVHPFNLGVIRFSLAASEITAGILSAAVEHNREALSLAQEHESPGLLNGATLQRIWLELARGEFGGNAATLRDRWPELRHHALFQPVTSLYIIWACTVTGDLAEGFAELESMNRYCAARELHWCDAELLLAEADLLGRRGRRDDIERAETLLRDAVALASRQGARLFALRAAMALFRTDPKRQDVRATLAEIRHGFPPGSTSPLLVETARMLEGGPRSRAGKGAPKSHSSK